MFTRARLIQAGLVAAALTAGALVAAPLTLGVVGDHARPLVGEADPSRVGSLAVGEPPGRSGLGLVERAVGAAGDLGAEDDLEAVDEIRFEQLADDAAAGQGEEVASRLPPELGDDIGG
jgi:hypothetical protein